VRFGVASVSPKLRRSRTQGGLTLRLEFARQVVARKPQTLATLHRCGRPSAAVHSLQIILALTPGDALSLNRNIGLHRGALIQLVSLVMESSQPRTAATTYYSRVNARLSKRRPCP